jgi:hypothetical protein
VATLVATEWECPDNGLERHEGGAHVYINGKNCDLYEEKEIQKSMCVFYYTKHIGGVDSSNHYCITFHFIWKLLKW